MKMMDFQQIEKRSARYLQEQFLPGAPHRILKGTVPIMFSAPHAVEQVRKGRVKWSESHTAVLAELLHERADAHAIIKMRNLQDDANYDEQSSFRDDLIQYIQKSNVKLLIDLHIMRESNEHTIEMASGKGKNIQQNWELIEKIAKLGTQFGLEKIVTDINFFALNPYCIAAHIGESCSIPAIQLEINWGMLKKEKGFKQILSYFEALCHQLI